MSSAAYWECFSERLQYRGHSCCNLSYAKLSRLLPLHRPCHVTPPGGILHSFAEVLNASIDLILSNSLLKMPRNPTNIGQKRTPLGGGKRSRKRQCRLAAQARWKSKSDVLLSENKDLTSHVLRADGDAERSDYTNLNGLDGVQEPAGEQDNQSTARRKLRVMRDCVREAAGSDTKQRCILELSSLNKILAAVPCSFCGGLLAAVFGDKMGFSREIKVVCEVCGPFPSSPAFSFSHLFSTQTFFYILVDYHTYRSEHYIIRQQKRNKQVCVWGRVCVRVWVGCGWRGEGACVC